MLVLLLACQDPPADVKDSPGSDSVPVETDTDTDTDTDADTDTDTDTDTETGDDTAPPDAGPPIAVLFIGDGMGREHVAGGGWYVNGAPGTLRMEGMPYLGSVRTASLTGTTDSAAAATAMATGVKTWNGQLGLDGDGLDVESLVERARARGMSVGIVTTDGLTGATPSAFTVHISSRGDTASIAAALVAELPDVALGGDLTNLGPLVDPKAVQVVLDEPGLAAAVDDGRPLLGLFAPGTFAFVRDGYTTQPTLAEMTTAAIRRLDADPDGFFLMVEGARIDHASHSNLGTHVFDEVAGFDEAVGAALDYFGERAATVLVTADHECGGLHLTGTSGAGEDPPLEWRWGSHTNDDVYLFGSGPHAEVIDGARVENTWVHAVLAAVIDGADAVTPPAEVPVVDGWLDDLGSPVAVQSWDTSFGAGYNQLDAIRVSADGNGLRVGLDGVLEDDGNTLVLLVDTDYGAGTGWPRDVVLTDVVGALDAVFTGLQLEIDDPTFGAEVLVGTIGAEEVSYTPGGEGMGLRAVAGSLGNPDDFGWFELILAFDDGNLARFGDPAADAGVTGATLGGVEALLPWRSLYDGGLSGPASLAVAAVLVNSDGDWISNQALPPFADGTEPGDGTARVVAAVAIEVDAWGGVSVPATVVP